jgi:D-alanyl-D-alanine dipeptidase
VLIAGALMLLVAAGAPPGGLAAPAPRAAGDFVDLQALEPTIRLDVRYATADNVLGRPLYPSARAFLRRPVAEALLRVHRSLAASGYGLVVFDAYRPWSVTKVLWDETPPAKRGFVANPARGSNHNRGCAVDLSLYALATGAAVPMPSGYDEMTPRSASDFPGGTAEARAHRDRLRAAMEAEGFRVERHEWWHFNHRDCSRYPVHDVPFDLLLSPGAAGP